MSNGQVTTLHSTKEPLVSLDGETVLEEFPLTISPPVATTGETTPPPLEVGTGIPLLLHQIWIGPTDSALGYPQKYESHRLSLQRHNHDFTFRLWNERDILGLFDDYPELRKYRQLYSNLYYPIMRADIARVMVIYSQGGVYLDLDVIGYRPLSELLGRYPSPVLLTLESKTGHSPRIWNGFLASTTRNPFWLGFLDHVSTLLSKVRCQAGMDVTSKTGPYALIGYAETSGYEWREWLVPSRLIMPHLPNGHLTREAEEYWISDGPYVSTIWADGTGWQYGIAKDYGLEIFQNYAAIVVASIFIVLVVFGWGRRYQL